MVYLMFQYVFDPACLPAFFSPSMNPLPQLQCTDDIQLVMYPRLESRSCVFFFLYSLPQGSRT